MVIKVTKTAFILRGGAFIKKEYIDIDISWLNGGTYIPKSFILNDLEYEIDGIHDVRDADASSEVEGLRYTVSLKTKGILHLFYEKITNSWFIETEGGLAGDG